MIIDKGVKMLTPRKRIGGPFEALEKNGTAYSLSHFSLGNLKVLLCRFIKQLKSVATTYVPSSLHFDAKFYKTRKMT